MSLLHNSDIEDLVKVNINGEIARVGGSVDQVIKYDSEMRVQDINILDGGFDSIKSIFNVSGLTELKKVLQKRIKQEIRYIRRGNCIARDRKTIELDMHYVQSNKGILHKFDSSISSNVIEHSPNVIFFLLNFYLITKEGGWFFHAIPNHKYTYDRFREPTELSHFIKDFESKIFISDRSHDQDYIQSAIEKDGWQREFHKEYPVEYPYMHYHVFNKENTEELFSMMFEDVTCDVIKNDKFADNVVIGRNRLKKEFEDKFSDLILEVKNGSYLKFGG